MTLKEQIKKLVKYQEWAAVKTWFSYWDTEEELAEKVILWGRLFLPNYFREKSPEFHRDLLKAFFTKEDEYIAAPRGFSKTTLMQTAIMFRIVNKMDHFIVVVEKNFTEAAEVLFAIRDEFGNNDLLRGIYGDLVTKDGKEKDAQGDMFINGVRLRAKGFNSPIRGLKSKEFRPTTIFVDDVEEDVHIQSIDQRIKYKTNFTQGLIPAVDITGNIKMVGTILHRDSLLQNLIDQHGGVIYKAYDKEDPENTLLWEDRWSYEQLERKKKQMMIEGLGTAKFFQEYLNEPVDDDFRPFKWEWLQKTYEELPEHHTVYACIDVADSVSASSDYTGVVVAALDDQFNWYILEAKRHKVTIKELVEVIFDIWKRFDPVEIGVEKKSFEFQVGPLLKDKSEQTNIWPTVVELKHSGKSKENRIIGALQGRFENGKIQFQDNPKDDQKILQAELYDFPSGKNDDLADALAYISTFASKPYHSKRQKGVKVDPAFHDSGFDKALAGISEDDWTNY